MSKNHPKTLSWNRNQRHKIFVIGVAFVLSTATIVVFPLTTLAISGQTIASLTNNARSSNGLSSLAWNARLANSAWLKAQDMCVKGYWAHTAPDGASGWTFMSQSGYAYVAAGENLARGFSDDSATVAGWMASTGHRANVLNPAYADIGVGYASCLFEGVETTFVVAHYGATATASRTAQARPKVVAPTTKAAVTSVKPEPVPSRAAAASPPAIKPAEPSFGAKLWKLAWGHQPNLGVFSGKPA